MRLAGLVNDMATKRGFSRWSEGLAWLLSLFMLGSLLTACGGGCDCEPDGLDLATVEIVDGNAQTGPVGQPLTKALVVRLLTSSGTPATGQTLSFAVVGGGGSAFARTVAADSAGYARTQWTLGTVAGPQRIELRSVGRDGTPNVWGSMDATATRGPPAMLAVAAGDGQSAEQMQPLANPIGAKVTDRYGNPCEGVTVAFAAGSGGSAATSTATSDTEGMAGTQWTLGLPIGQQTLEASVPGLSSVSFAATATRAPSGPPVAISKVAGDQQIIRQHTQMSLAMNVRVTDRLGNGVDGVPVTFSGYGNGWTAFGGFSGAPESYWHVAGEHTVSASVEGIGTVSFNVTVVPWGEPFDGFYLIQFTYYSRTGLSMGSYSSRLLLSNNDWSSSDDGTGSWNGFVQPADGATTLSYQVKPNWRDELTGVMSLNAYGRAVGSGTFISYDLDVPNGVVGTWSATRF